MQFKPVFFLLFAFFAFGLNGTALSAERLVILFKDSAVASSATRSSDLPSAHTANLLSRLSELVTVHKQPLQLIRPFGERGAIVFAAGTQNLEQTRLRLLSDPLVQSVEIDRRIKLHAQSPLIGLLNGLDFSRRSRSWFHQDLASQPASINTGEMWARFHGTSPTVVAVLDTGVLPSHPMLAGHLLPGYDFVSDALIAADGQRTGSSERDSDPTDPGDGVGAADLLADPACSGLSGSSWHGTFVSGLIAGNPAPSEGIFSVNWNATVVPVRVLGKCGGFSTDLADGIRWAAGLPVPGVPANPFPARVINLSLGAQGACVASIEGAAVAAAREAGALVVVAAGNDGASVDSPANCPGAFGVAAVDQEGLKANYSNFGRTIQLSAPGGDSAFPIWGATNSGISGPLTNTYNTKIGTSFASPMVAAAASLYLSLNPTASVASVENLLKSTSRPFLALNNRPACSTNSTNSSCNCITALCGAGMLDVANLVNTSSTGGLTNLFSNSGNVVTANDSIRFSSVGSTDASGQEVAAVSYSLINVLKTSPSVADPVLTTTGLQAEITAPAGVSGFDIRAQVANGRTSVASVVIANPGTTSPTILASLLSPLLNGVSTDLGIPATDTVDSPVAGSDASAGPASSSGSGGGGGGSLSFWGLLLLAFLAAAHRHQQRLLAQLPKNNG